jgi:hypothetical protein
VLRFIIAVCNILAGEEAEVRVPTERDDDSLIITNMQNPPVNSTLRKIITGRAATAQFTHANTTVMGNTGVTKHPPIPSVLIPPRIHISQRAV